MTTLYRPVLIETAEQAEALPIGTVAAPMYEDGPDFVYALVHREETYEPWCNSDGSHARGHGELDGFVALVPIEAEEEWAAQDAHGGRTLPSAGHPDPRTQIAAHVDTLAGLGVRDVPVRRFVTEWTEEV